MVTVKFKKLVPEARMPYRGSKYAAGWDLFATSLDEKNYTDVTTYHTGIALEIPEGYYGLVLPRSSIYQTNRRFVGSGVIDSDFRGEILVFMDYVKDLVCPAVYKPGDRVGQLIISPIPEVQFTEVAELGNSLRGTNGYGSTGGFSLK